jgi:Cu/Ag efflux protein CusF
MKSLPPQEKSIDGPVKKVDPASKTVQVGWGLGLFRTTLEVNDDTHIAVGGTKASLMDIREGDRVKAAYETREGKNIAKSIEVAPAGEKGKPMEGPGGLQKTPEAPKAPTPPQAQ